MNIRMNRFNGIYFSNFKWGIMAILCFSLGGCSSTGGMADTEYAVVTQKLEQNEADITFYRSLYHCAQFMHEGKYKSAQPYCAIAGDIRPDDDAYRRTYQMLRDEMESYEEWDMPLDTLEQNAAAKSKSKAQKKETKKRKNAQTSHEDVKELCAQAVRTKIQKKNCESYKYYKKALAIGGVDATCMRNAKTHISTFASECD